MNDDKDTRQAAEEDAKEDLELETEEADKVGGAQASELNVKKIADKW